MIFYRYEIVSYASIEDEYGIIPTLPNVNVVIHEFSLIKETKKGYWIGYGFLNLGKLRGNAKWVSKSSVKRYAYPTKEEALNNLIKRSEKRISILKSHILKINLGLSKAEKLILEATP